MTNSVPAILRFLVADAVLIRRHDFSRANEFRSLDLVLQLGQGTKIESIKEMQLFFSASDAGIFHWGKQSITERDP